MFFVYVIYSPRLDTFYKGQCNDLIKRIHRHNSGFENYTKTGIPWNLVWYTTKPSRPEALKLERKLKNLSRSRLMELMKKYPINVSVTGLDVFDLPDQ